MGDPCNDDRLELYISAVDDELKGFIAEVLKQRDSTDCVLNKEENLSFSCFEAVEKALGDMNTRLERKDLPLQCILDLEAMCKTIGETYVGFTQQSFKTTGFSKICDSLRGKFQKIAEPNHIAIPARVRDFLTNSLVGLE